MTTSNSVAAGVIAIMAATAASIFLLTDEQRREIPLTTQLLDDAAQRADLQRSVERMDEEPMECRAIELDGDRENLRRRLVCNGIAVVDACAMPAQDRAQLERMGMAPSVCP